MKVIRGLLIGVIFSSLIFVGCHQVLEFESEVSNGDVKELIFYLPEKEGTWIYEGTGVYYHQMILEDIVKLSDTIFYKIKGEILSDQQDSTYDEYLTEIRYSLSPKGWQQEISKSKLLDSRYKGMYLLKFPLEVNNTWHENVLDFQGKQVDITSKIKSIETVAGKKVITVKYEEDKSDYYEVREIKEGIGVVDFKQNLLVNGNYQELEYSLSRFYPEIMTKDQVLENLLVRYNKAWANYYNNDTLEIFEYILENSILESNILAFGKMESVEISFEKLTIESIEVDEDVYTVLLEEVFNVVNEKETYEEKSTKTYTIIKKGNAFKIKSIE